MSIEISDDDLWACVKDDVEDAVNDRLMGATISEFFESSEIMDEINFDLEAKIRAMPGNAQAGATEARVKEIVKSELDGMFQRIFRLMAGNFTSEENKDA